MTTSRRGETRDDGTGRFAPLPLRTDRIIIVGIGVWALALVITVAVPALRTGERDWWPWCCLAGIVLGSMGLGYVVRGRGNAADAAS